MVGFLVKKSFFDGWDNLIRLVVMNLIYLALFGLIFLLPSAWESVSPLALAALVIPGFFLLMTYTGFLGPFLTGISRYESLTLKDGWDLFKKNLRTIVFFSILNLVVLILTGLSLPFYIQMGGVLGAAGAGLVFWVLLFWLGSTQFFFPLLCQMGGGTLKNIKKGFIILLDNPGFSLFTMAGTIFITAVSIFTAFLIPGLSNALLFQHEAMKLRLLKYDYLEETRETAGPGKIVIPWDTLLSEDRENVGPRTLKGMIFPWKD
jgi:hypothetical protein